MSLGRRFVVLLSMLLVLGILPLWAQEDYRVTAFVRPESGIDTATAFRFVIQVVGVGQPQVVPPRLVKLTNLALLGGPETSSSFEWSNGRTSSNYQLIYTMLAESPGVAKIPAMEIQVDSKTYRTEPITLQVGAEPKVAPQQPQQRNRPQTQGQAPDSVDVLLESELGASEVWLGQVVPLNVTLYAANQVSNPDWRSFPDFANFWVETLEVDPNRESYRTRRNGRNYNAYPIERRLIVPPSPGEFEIEPFVLQLQVHLSRNDPFDFFSRRRSQTIVRKTKPLLLKVRALPGGAPAGYTGAVGRYTMTAELDRSETQTNDAVALTVTVRGEGSLKSVSPPILDFPDDLKVFDPKVKESSNTRKGKMISTKSWEWILVPLAPGEMTLPELVFTYFNPSREQYEVARADPLELAVIRGDGVPDPTTVRTDIQLQRRDLMFIKPLRGNLAQSQPRAHERKLFLVMALLPLGLLPLVVLLGRQRDRLQRDQGLARSRRAKSLARKRFSAIGKKTDQVDSTTFHEEVARTLVDYVADRFDRSAAGLTYDLADELLQSRSVDADLRRRFRSCLEACDFARFVPSAGKSERRAEILAEAEAIVQELESSR